MVDSSRQSNAKKIIWTTIKIVEIIFFHQEKRSAHTIMINKIAKYKNIYLIHQINSKKLVKITSIQNQIMHYKRMLLTIRSKRLIVIKILILRHQTSLLTEFNTITRMKVKIWIVYPKYWLLLNLFSIINRILILIFHHIPIKI